MNDQRFIIEMGMGNSLYNLDYTKAADRAIDDALRHSSIPMFETLGISHAEMRVQVTIGVQEPEKVDCAALTAKLPRGNATVKAVFGGLNVENPDRDGTIVIASAAVEAFLPNMADRF